MSGDRPAAEADSAPPLAPAVPAESRSAPLARLYRRLQPYEIFLVMGAALVILVPGIWAYTLIDPWETHYAEVARSIVEDDDWVFLEKQDESFRSKPVLTFWLIAGSMSTFGVATDGGYSGELATSSLGIFAVRLPFVLFAVMGITLIWWMLAALVNRRVAWLSFAVLVTTPFLFFVARQSITDMPMVACLMGCVALFCMAVHAGDEPLEPIWRRVNAHHLFLGALALIVGWQAIYYIVYFIQQPRLAPGIRVSAPGFVLGVPMLVGLAAFAASSIWGLPGKVGAHLAPRTTTRRQVYMFWFFVLVGISALAKGPPGIGLTGLICLLYLVVTGHWRLLGKFELFRGVLLSALVAVPWHVAMFFKDGRAWANLYFNHHMLKRFGNDEVHGDNGTFDYFAAQIGIGMWWWAALLPAALATIFVTANRHTQEGRVRLVAGIWAIAGVALFCASETKFHHYILPAIPALSLCVAFWLDDFIAGRVRKTGLVALLAIGIVALIGRDILGEHELLIELFIYRHDRPWPSGEPWNLDLRSPLLLLTVALMLGMGALALPRRFRRVVAAGLVGIALAAALWIMNGYMGAAAPHWGQQALHQTYYAERDIHGVEIEYYGLADLARDWGSGEPYLVESVLPRDFQAGAPMEVTLMVPGAGVPGDEVVLRGTVARFDRAEDRFWIDVPQAERAKLAELIERGRRAGSSPRPPWMQVDADRLIAWQLNWHGENFWSGGEIYGATEDTRTVFMKTDNKAFLAYLKAPERADRTFYVITESGRAKGLRGILPTQRAKDTFEILDTSCNKFTLLRFSL